MNVLITSIVRNESKFLDKWYSQIKAVVAAQPENNFSLSVFENDSSDDSYAKISSYDWGFLKSYIISTAKLNSPYFIGGKHPTRTQLLAFCRNHAIYSFPFLNEMDYVLVIEPDVEYSLETADKIINHERHYGRKFDVFTGKSVHPGTDHLYDSWGTRKGSAQTDWKEEDGESGGLSAMWTTFNCMAIYRAEPIKKGLCFTGINPRTNLPDCDASNICEVFRLNGYNQIYWDTNLPITHNIN